MITIILILKIILASFCGYIFSEQLTKPGMIFNGLYLILEKAFSANTFWFDRCKGKWKLFNPEFIFKPIIGCFRCVCGQWAMWAYIVQTAIYHTSEFNLFYCFASACIGVTVGIISHKILNDE